MFLNMGNKYINVFGNSNEFNTGTGLVLRNAYAGHGFTCIYFGNDASFNAGAVWQGSSNYTYYAGPSSMNIGTLINSPLGLVTGNSVRMLITSGGNVGVGTNTPQAKLDVVGDVKATNTPKAWASFNGKAAVGTNQPIRASYNITSILRTDDNLYQVTFPAGLFSNTDYAFFGTSSSSLNRTSILSGPLISAPTATTFKFGTFSLVYTGQPAGWIGESAECISIAFFAP
jgi:hypothetical protein